MRTTTTNPITSPPTQRTWFPWKSETCRTTATGKGHKGVFAAEDIPRGTRLRVWTHRVVSIHRDDPQNHIDENFRDDRAKIRVSLRQGFVLPPSSSSSSETMTPPASAAGGVASGPTAGAAAAVDDECFRSNPSDSGRLTNHSPDPNMGPDGALRDIRAGEELTMDYSFHGNPEWYRAVCARYGVMTEAEVAAAATSGALTERSRRESITNRTISDTTVGRTTGNQ